MTVDKYQKFLKSKHKFDPKPDMQDTVLIFEDHFYKTMTAIKNENSEELGAAVKPFFIDLLKMLNRHDILLTDLIKDEYNH